MTWTDERQAFAVEMTDEFVIVSQKDFSTHFM